MKSPEVSQKGRATALTPDEEESLLKFIIGSAERGCPKTSKDVIETANAILKRRGGQIVGRGWLKSFKKRKNLSIRIPDKLSKASANISKENIKGWFKTVEDFVSQHPDYSEALKNKKRVFNADESMLVLNPTSQKVLAPKGMKYIYQVSKDHKFGITVMTTFRADGKAFKPFIIYPQTRVSTNISSNFPQDSATLASTPSGWMDSHTFCIYLQSFAEDLEQNRVQLPVLLFLDNHASHVGLEAAEKAESLGIKLIFLYPNSTFLLQPADVTVFKSLKSIWKEDRRSSPVSITKQNFAPHFMQAFSKIDPKIIRSGFFNTGIFPFDPENVNYSRCLGRNISGKDFMNSRET